MNAADIAGVRSFFGKRYPQSRFDYDGNGNCIYIGIAAKGAASSASNWIVFSLTYDASNQVTLIQSAEAISWDSRATATYS